MTGELINIILGMKVRQARTEAGLTLTDLAKLAEMSASYLTEIEKGRKYPRHDKIMRLAQALGKRYDELVSITLRPSLSYLETALSSSILSRFPFAEFGFHADDLVNLLTREPEKASALLHAVLDIGRQYDLQEEEFLRAALRSYQEIHDNYFPELEDAALAFTAKFGQTYAFADDGPMALPTLRAILQQAYAYRLDETTLAAHPELSGYRSVYLEGKRPLLLINPALYPRQVKFLLARELGYQYLGLTERSTTSTPDDVTSFTQLLNDYKAAYFGGALLMPRAATLADLRHFFEQTRWQPQRLADLLARYDVTPEMLFYRFSELIPQHFSIQTHFLRFHQETDRLRLVRHLNFNRLLVPSGIGLQEHYCRRWLSARLLRDMRAAQLRDAAWDRYPLPGIHISRFHAADGRDADGRDADDRFVAIGFARSLVLTPDVNSSVTLGFRLTPELHQTVRFLDDPAIPHAVINETCERCPLTAAECDVRAAPPTVLQDEAAKAARRAKLAQIRQMLHDS